MLYLSHSPEQTRQHASDFTSRCQAGTVIRLHGTLGAGKTTWVQGFVNCLGCPTEATSPTFALLHEYTGGRLEVFHWDLYRLEPGTDWSVLELAEHLPSCGITLIEWSENYPGPWPEANLWDVRIDVSSETTRSISALPSHDSLT
jgi:tRNA threonylcarbamoyladenosine biosynthesis protein TsaE